MSGIVNFDLLGAGAGRQEVLGIAQRRVLIVRAVLEQGGRGTEVCGVTRRVGSSVSSEISAKLFGRYRPAEGDNMGEPAGASAMASSKNSPRAALRDCGISSGPK